MQTASVAKRRVLLVDDEPVTLMMISQILRSAGYQTAQANCGADALKLAAEFEPDLALLDVMMPGMSGLELAAQLQAQSEIPFMFISANAEAEIIKQATEHGAVGYLLKPFDAAQVIPAFEAALSRADEIRHLRDQQQSLTTALNASRETSMAVGLLMAKFHVDRELAFNVLRNYSRSNRSKMNQVAEQLLTAEELINSFQQLFAKSQASSQSA